MAEPEQKLGANSQDVGLAQKAKDVGAEALIGVENDMDSLRVVGHVPYKDGCCWHRVFRPLSHLKQAGKLGQFETSNVLAFKEWVGTYPRPFNVVINQRIFGSVSLALARAFGWMLMLECDDDYWNITKKNPAHKWMKERRRFLPYFASTIPKAWGMVTTTPALVTRFEELGAKRVFIAKNGLNFSEFDETVVNNNPNVCRIGWAGSAHHVDDLEQMVNVLKELKLRYGDAIELVFMGYCPDQLKGMVEYHESVSVEKYEHAIRMLGLDVAIAPLLNSKFNISKSNLKWLEYSAMGVPTVASDVSTYAEIQDGTTGLLANNKREWNGALEFLIDNPQKRAEIGEDAFQWTRERYDISVTSKGWLDALTANMDAQKKMFNGDEKQLEQKIQESIVAYRAALHRSNFYNNVRTKIRRKTKNAKPKRKGYNTRLPFQR